MNLRIRQISECQVCKKFLESHPTLDVKKVKAIYISYPNGTWRHATESGVMLHNYVVNKNGEINS